MGRVVWLRFRSGVIMIDWQKLYDDEEEERAKRKLKTYTLDDTTDDDEDVPKTHAKKPKRDHGKNLMTSLVH